MRREALARILVFILIVLATSIPAVGWWQHSQGVVMHARMAETGGWTPANLTVAVGEPLRLRLTSDDVTHSFAIGQSDRPPVDVIPGEMAGVTLVFDRPGKYTFYCTRWCSVNHWRMRGVIEVTSKEQTTPEKIEAPLYVILGLDIDAEHHTEDIPEQIPSARRGAQLNQIVPGDYQSREYYLSHTPVDLWKALRFEAAFQELTDQDIWDVVAWVWQFNTTPQELKEGEQLYATNCSACHGETGKGDGVFAGQLAGANTGEHAGTGVGEMTTRPVDFTGPGHMLAASPAHLQGKIIRGGMGTGMPYWGPIFTENQTWALVAYLWTFQLDLN
jgi:plastocyanin